MTAPTPLSRPAEVVANDTSLVELAVGDRQAAAIDAGVAVNIIEWINSVVTNIDSLIYGNMTRLFLDEDQRNAFLLDATLYKSLKSNMHSEKTGLHLRLPFLHIPTHWLLADLCIRKNVYFVPTHSAHHYRIIEKKECRSSSEQEFKQLQHVHELLASSTQQHPTFLHASSKQIMPLTLETITDVLDSQSIWMQFPQKNAALIEAMGITTGVIEKGDTATEEPPTATPLPDGYQRYFSQVKKVFSKWYVQWKKNKTQPAHALRTVIARTAGEKVKTNFIKPRLASIKEDSILALEDFLLSQPGFAQNSLPEEQKRALCQRLATRLINKLGAPVARYVTAQFTVDEELIAQKKAAPFSYQFAEYKENTLALISTRRAAELLQDSSTCHTVFLQHRKGYSHAEGIPDPALLTAQSFTQQPNSDLLEPLSFKALQQYLRDKKSFIFALPAKASLPDRYVTKDAYLLKSDEKMQTFTCSGNDFEKETIPLFSLKPGHPREYAAFGSTLTACHYLHTFFRTMRSSFLKEDLIAHAATYNALLSPQPTSLQQQEKIARFFSKSHTFIRYDSLNSRMLSTIFLCAVSIAIIEFTENTIQQTYTPSIISFVKQTTQRCVELFQQWRVAPLDADHALNTITLELKESLLEHLKTHGALGVPLLPIVELLFTGHTQLIPAFIDIFATPSQNKYGKRGQKAFHGFVLKLESSPFPDWYQSIWRTIIEKILHAFFMLRTLDKSYTVSWGEYISTHQQELKQLLEEYAYIASPQQQPITTINKLDAFINQATPLKGSSLITRIIAQFSRFKGPAFLCSSATGYHAFVTGKTYAVSMFLLPVIWKLITTKTPLKNYPTLRYTLPLAGGLLTVGALIGHRWIEKKRMKTLYDTFLEEITTSPKASS